MQNILTRILLLFLIAGLVVSVFKNIGYPIIWGDEADTVMYAERILKYGYPKVHDGHNSLNYNMISGNVGVNEKYDAWTVTMWGQYYLAAPVVSIASGIEDIYQKTAVLRWPFAIFGLIGILTLPLVVIREIPQERKVTLWIIYVFITILSVSLILHIKEVRSYAFSILFSSLFLNIFVRFHFYKSLNKISYYIFATFVLFLLINTFPPGYLSISFAAGLYLLVKYFLQHRVPKTTPNVYFKTIVGDILPILISGILTLPILLFFKTSGVSASAYSDMHFGIGVYFSYISRIIVFLFRYHFLTLLLFLIAFLFFFVWGKVSEVFLDYLRKNNILSFLLLIYLFYIPAVATTPYMFDRYFLFLQPLTTLLIVYLFIVISNYISTIKDVNKRQNLHLLFIYGLTLTFILNVLFLYDILKGRIFELTHKYYGPMDSIVGYVKDNYENPRDLVIFTNIEQPVLIYYLESGVLCDEITDCHNKSADIIIPRQGYLQKDFVGKIETLLKDNEYETVKLPILDYPSNNIPEFSLGLRHLFKTPATDNDKEKVLMFVKRK